VVRIDEQGSQIYLPMQRKFQVDFVAIRIAWLIASASLNCRSELDKRMIFGKIMSIPQSIGFIGLGNMGQGMASNLLKAGYPLRVYNRSREKARLLVEQGATLVDQPGDVVEPGGIVFTMLSDDLALRSVVLENPDFAKRLAPAGIHVSSSTISPDTAREVSNHHARNDVTFLSAPVIGRPDRAATGTLFILLAGKSEAKTKVAPLLERVGQRVFDFGEDPWLSNVAKLAFNFNIAAAIEIMAESFTLAEKNGIPRQKMAELLSETLFSGVVYRGYGDLIARHAYEPAGFRLVLGWKDIRLILQLAAESATPLPIGSLVRDRLLSAMAKGRENLDWSALALGASDDAGLPR
jgi:3-hydroxyisobutyrate dehydrogenase-like beta-hydroxyacid dehydrogenase